MEEEDTNKEIIIKVKVNIKIIIVEEMKNKIKINNIIIRLVQMIETIKFSISNILKDMVGIMKVQAMFMHRNKSQLIIKIQFNNQFKINLQRRYHQLN